MFGRFLDVSTVSSVNLFMSIAPFPTILFESTLLKKS